MMSILFKRIKRSQTLNSITDCVFTSRRYWKKVKKWSGSRQYEVVTPGIVSETLSVPETVEKPCYWLSGQPQANIPPFPEIKTAGQIEKMRSSCRLAATILHSLKDIIKVGITTDAIDKRVHDLCVNSHCVYPSPLNYNGFPKSVCTSVNNVACHGIPDNRTLADGDIINVDITVYKDGYHGDCSAMFLVGNVDSDGRRLSEVCCEALDKAVAICRPKQMFSAIGTLIEDIAEQNGFTVIPCFTGHGIGSYFHGPPDIYHIKYNYEGMMEAGMTFTIEPVLGEGSKEIIILEDGWTAVTEDSSRTAQWEHTILITETGAEVLTKLF